ncbi:MAG: SGNH/GDSL hydrolase family protein, partial [Acidobacteriota bacterium]
MKKTLIVLTLAALLGAVPASAQVDFTRYVALGDSLTAGIVSGGLVQYYQDRSYPAYLAQQAGAPVFAMPTVSEPGLAPLLELLALVPAPVIQPKPGAPGMPTNAEYPYPYNNLGVPGANTFNLLATTGDIYNLMAGNLDNVMHDLVLRIPEVPDPATGDLVPFTALTQAIAQDPTFVTLWIGNNDILGAAITATPIDGITMTPLDVFQQLYGQALGALATMTTADIIAINLPDATSIPFVTTVSNYLTVPGMGTFQLMGEDGPIGDDDYITLAASSLIAQGY